jgi:integrase
VGILRKGQREASMSNTTSRCRSRPSCSRRASRGARRRPLLWTRLALSHSIPRTHATADTSTASRQLDPTTLVFPNTEGNRDFRWAKRIIPAALRDAKIADFRFHDLRHTFASRLAMEGVDRLTIKELGGWKSLQMVQRYAHLSPSHRRSAIERLVRRPSSAEPAKAVGAE